MFVSLLRARLPLGLMFCTSLVGCAKTPIVDSRLDSVEGKPFSDPSAGLGGAGEGGAGACGILSCRYIAVGAPACADYYVDEGWTPEDVAKDCKAAAAAVQTTTLDANPQAPCIQAGAAKDGMIGGQCAIKGALAEYKSRNVYAYGMTEGLCTGIKDLEGVWNEVPFDPCPDAPQGEGGISGGSSGDGGVADPNIFSCRHSEGLLAAKRCTDYPGVYSWDATKAAAACSELNGMFSADKTQACIEGGFAQRCARPDQSYLYGVDSCDGLFGVLEILGAAQPPEKGPFDPYSAVSCGNDTPADTVYTCRYDGFAASCADYPSKEGWSEVSAAAHCALLPNSKNHKMGGSSCLADSKSKADSTRCRVADPAVCDQVYYGYEIPDFVCTGGLIAGKTEQQKAPYAASY